LGVEQRLLVAAEQIRPDLIFLHLQQADVVEEYAAQKLSEIGFVVNYTFDVRNAETTQWMYDLAPHIGLSIFACVEDALLCKQKYGEAINMHSSCDYNWYRDYGMKREGIVFIGNNFLNTNLDFPQKQQRYEMVMMMQEEFKDQFKVYGTNWDIKGVQMINPQEEINAYNAAKIAITHNNFVRIGYTSDRLFRAMGCGAATISHYFPLINKDFNQFVLGTWLNFDMLKEGCHDLLENDERIRLLGAAGAEWVRKHHSWGNRFTEMLKYIKQLQIASNGTNDHY
jgi:spore maturation protein CgeB